MVMTVGTDSWEPLEAIQEGPILPWRPRTEIEIIAEQLRAIDAWNAARRAVELSEVESDANLRSREMRLDAGRRIDVIRRQHQALTERTEEHMRRSVHVLEAAAPPRAVLVHRSSWFRGKVAEALTASGVHVVAELVNGADAVGTAVAEQPDLMLVEDKLEMINAEEVIPQVLGFAPQTIVAAQVSSEAVIPGLLRAGARSAFRRSVPPGAVARELCLLVSA